MDLRTHVVSIGGGAGHALDRLAGSGIADASLIAANTDAQDLKRSVAPTRLQFGKTVTRGLGSGGDPEVGADSARSDREAFVGALSGAKLVVLLVGLGAGTGTGAAPVVAALAREVGAVVVAIVTLPFRFEGKRRRRVAETGLAELNAACDGLVVVAHDGASAEEPRRTMAEAFAEFDGALVVTAKSLLADVANEGEVAVAARRWVNSRAGRT